jgi:hypothetical protein
VKLEKEQRDRVYREEREFVEVIEPSKLGGEHFYHHGTTKVRSVKIGL